jgi:hypothetical protein
MTPPTLRAIKCSERMPTREDADSTGDVLWLRKAPLGWTAANVGHFEAHIGRIEGDIYWLPLSAIATDAEGQRGEGGE